MECLSAAEWVKLTSEETARSVREDDFDLGGPPAVIIYTSGTTAAPKGVLLRHQHLASYVTGTVEFGSAADGDANLIAAPPYHIAAVANTLSSLYAGRRIVPLPRFSAGAWLSAVRSERVTNAFVVPTMLARRFRS